MNKTNRKQCILCKNTDFEKIISIRKFPALMGTSFDVIDYLENLKVLICKNCGTIQLGSLLPLDFLYKQTHGAGNIGKTWDDHHANFAKFINYHRNIFEIGGGSNANLARKYLKLNSKAKWAICEPGVVEFNNSKIKYYNNFFDDTFTKNCSLIKFDAIVHSHVLEHIYEPLNFLKLIAKNINIKSFLYISIPDMNSMINRLDGNLINFEHTYFCNYELVENLLFLAGFCITRTKNFKNHSIFIEAKKNNLETTRPLLSLYNKNNNKISRYYESIITDIKKINEKIEEKFFFIFGGHVFSQLLFSLGLHKKNLIHILDNDKKKEDKILYGTNILIKNPIIIKNFDSPNVIIRMGAYTDEIKKQLIQINNTVQFL